MAITLTYTKATNNLRDPALNELDAVTGHAVSNLVVPPANAILDRAGKPIYARTVEYIEVR